MSIPAQVSAARALAQGERYTGPVDASGLERLRDLSPENLHADFRMYTDSARRDWLEGHIDGQLTLSCRICMESFMWPLHAPVKLALATSEAEEERLMAICEPMLVLEDCLMLHDIVEEEVLLALPMMPKCLACENARPSKVEPSPAPTGKKPSPLAALKDLSLKGATPARRK